MGIFYIVRPTQLVVVFLHLIGLIVASAGVAGVSVGILTALLDMDTLTGLLYVLSWCGSLVLMGLTVGAVVLTGRRGVSIPILLWLLSMATVTLPREFLPELWANWIYPWTPLQFLGKGIRSLLYVDQSMIPGSTLLALGITLALGLVLLAAGMLKPVGKKEVAQHN